MSTDLERFKAQYFGAISRRTGIPAQFYEGELPPEAMAEFEAQQRARAEAQRKKRLEQTVGEGFLPVCSLRPKCRRPVGDFSLHEYDG